MAYKHETLHVMSLRKSNLKRDNTTHLIECKIQNTEKPNADENVEQQELSFLAGGNIKYKIQPFGVAVWQALVCH